MATNQQAVEDIVEGRFPVPELVPYYAKCLHKMMLCRSSKVSPVSISLAERVEEWKKSLRQGRKENVDYVLLLLDRAIRGRDEGSETARRILKDILWAEYESTLSTLTLRKFADNCEEENQSFKAEQYQLKSNFQFANITMYTPARRYPKKIRRVKEFAAQFIEIVPEYLKNYSEFEYMKYALLLPFPAVMDYNQCVDSLVNRYFAEKPNAAIKIVLRLLELRMEQDSRFLGGVLCQLASFFIIQQDPRPDPTTCTALKLFCELSFPSPEAIFCIQDYLTLIKFVCASISNSEANKVKGFELTYIYILLVTVCSIK